MTEIPFPHELVIALNEGRTVTTTVTYGEDGTVTVHGHEVSDPAGRTGTDWKRIAQHLCQHVETALDEQPDADGYRAVTVGPSEAEHLADLVAEVIAGAAAARRLFVLDRASNPHPRLLAEALKLRRRYRAAHADMKSAPRYSATARVEYEKIRSEWAGYRAAMTDATGLLTTEIEAWLDAHDA